MWFRNKKMTGKHQFNNGDIVVIYGETEFERELVKYTNAKDLVTHLRKKEYPDNNSMSNQEYMRTLLKNIQEYNESFVIPIHSEEAFISALIQLGLCYKTQLN